MYMASFQLTTVSACNSVEHTQQVRNVMSRKGDDVWSVGGDSGITLASLVFEVVDVRKPVPAASE